MKPIETLYRGYRFRSRTEARWAVFFDALNTKFVYELNGYVFDGQPYLPDFYLPDCKIWVEVKGKTPTDRERWLCGKLSAQSGCSVFLVVGAPWEMTGHHFMDGDEVDFGWELERALNADVTLGYDAAKVARFEFDRNNAGPAPRRRQEPVPFFRLYR